MDYDPKEMGVKKKRLEDFKSEEARPVLDQVADESGSSGHSPSAEATCATAANPAPTEGPQRTVSSRQADWPTVTEEEVAEPASPVCYLREFEDW